MFSRKIPIIISHRGRGYWIPVKDVQRRGGDKTNSGRLRIRGRVRIFYFFCRCHKWMHPYQISQKPLKVTAVIILQRLCSYFALHFSFTHFGITEYTLSFKRTKNWLEAEPKVNQSRSVLISFLFEICSSWFTCQVCHT